MKNRGGSLARSPERVGVRLWREFSKPHRPKGLAEYCGRAQLLLRAAWCPKRAPSRISPSGVAGLLGSTSELDQPGVPALFRKVVDHADVRLEVEGESVRGQAMAQHNGVLACRSGRCREATPHCQGAHVVCSALENLPPKHGKRGSILPAQVATIQQCKEKARGCSCSLGICSAARWPLPTGHGDA